MLNRDRIILMTKMASFEENEGKKSISICKYFRGDYIGWQVIKAVISSTVAYFVVLAAYIFYFFEDLMQDIYEMDLMAFGRKLVFYYVCFAVGYAVIAYIVYSIRYQHAKKDLKKYYGNLKRLNSMLSKEESEEHGRSASE